MRKLLCCTALLALMVSPAVAADVTAYFDPTDSSVGYNQTFWIDVVADIDEMTPIAGWGLDIEVQDPTIAAPTGNVDFTGLVWDQAFAPDGDGLAGLHFEGRSVTGTSVLVSVEFESFGNMGTTEIYLSDDNPEDLTEGFAIDPLAGGGFATTEYLTGSIFVPEPASLILLALGALLRRR